MRSFISAEKTAAKCSTKNKKYTLKIKAGQMTQNATELNLSILHFMPFFPSVIKDDKKHVLQIFMLAASIKLECRHSGLIYTFHANHFILHVLMQIFLLCCHPSTNMTLRFIEIQNLSHFFCKSRVNFY